MFASVYIIHPQSLLVVPCVVKMFSRRSHQLSKERDGKTQKDDVYIYGMSRYVLVSLLYSNIVSPDSQVEPDPL